MRISFPALSSSKVLNLPRYGLPPPPHPNMPAPMEMHSISNLFNIQSPVVGSI